MTHAFTQELLGIRSQYYSETVFVFQELLVTFGSSGSVLSTSLKQSLRVSGSFPGPLLYGAALDGSCILWEETCDQKGSCLYYDNHQMAWYMIALGLGCKLFNIFFAFLAWMVYKHKRPDQMEPQILREVSHSINSHREYVHETSRDGETEPVEDGAVNVAFVGTGDFSDQQMGKSDYSTFT